MVSSDTSISTLTAFNADDGRADSAQCRRPLRVLFYLFFPGGGIGRYTHELLRRMCTRPDLQVELVCMPSFHWIREASYPLWPRLFEIGHAVPWRRRVRFLMGQAINPRRLAARVNEYRADIVHLCNINHLTFPVWRKALENTGAKVACTAHDIRRARGVIHHGFEERQLQSFYRWADLLFVHGASQARDLVEFARVAPEKIRVVPHGPYDYGQPSNSKHGLRARYGLPQDQQIALFFGNIRDEKNLDLMMRAIQRVDQPLHLLVVGRFGGGHHRGIDEYRRLAAALELDGSITFMDRYVPDSEVPDLFALCDWVALPYSRSFTSQSGVLNLAVQYARPVLLSAHGILGEVLASCDVGVGVNPDDEDALAVAIPEICRRVQDGHTFRFEQYMQIYSWDENVQRTVAAYRLLDDDRPRSVASETDEA